jgi:hypothetical protein
MIARDVFSARLSLAAQAVINLTTHYQPKLSLSVDTPAQPPPKPAPSLTEGVTRPETKSRHAVKRDG